MLCMLQQAGDAPQHSKAEAGPSSQASAEQQQQLLLHLQQGSSAPRALPEHRQALQRMSQHASGDLQQAPSNASERMTECSLRSHMGHAS